MDKGVATARGHDCVSPDTEASCKGIWLFMRGSVYPAVGADSV